jgi:flavin reductase (DIM6/NTAB) family NADH-FMN oxidoreductase RutF
VNKQEENMKKSLGAKALVFPAPVWCIGSYDAEGKPNVMTASWVGICCSQPPAVTVSLRKATYTYHNIMTTKAFTISVPSQKYAREADFFGMVSGKNTNKFDAAGLTPAKATKVQAPYVGEFQMVLECKVIHTYEIGLHTQFIGEILDVMVDEAILAENGLPDLLKLDPFVYAAENRSYHGVRGRVGKAFSLGKSIYG